MVHEVNDALAKMPPPSSSSRRRSWRCSRRRRRGRRQRCSGWRTWWPRGSCGWRRRSRRSGGVTRGASRTSSELAAPSSPTPRCSRRGGRRVRRRGRRRRWVCALCSAALHDVSSLSPSRVLSPMLLVITTRLVLPEMFWYWILLAASFPYPVQCLVRLWIPVHTPVLGACVEIFQRDLVSSSHLFGAECCSGVQDIRVFVRDVHICRTAGSTVDTCRRQTLEVCWTNFRAFLRESGLRILRSTSSSVLSLEEHRKWISLGVDCRTYVRICLVARGYKFIVSLR